MRQYLRTRVPGGTYFLTIAVADRSAGALLVREIDALRTALAWVKERRPFHIDAMVVLPDHLHALWTLPVGDADYSTRISLFKAKFSRSIAETESISSSRRMKRERGVWQRRFHEHTIRDERDFARHVDYIHFNPVKHRWAAKPVDWVHSSIHRWIARGDLSADWATDPGALAVD